MVAAPREVKGNLLRRSWERRPVSGYSLLGRLSKSECDRAGSHLAEMVAQRPTALHCLKGIPAPLQRGNGRGRSLPAEGARCKAAAETPAKRGRRQAVWGPCRRLLRSPSDHPQARPPGRVRPATLRPEAAPVFSLLQGKTLFPRLGLPGFTSWRLTMDSGPWGGRERRVFEEEARWWRAMPPWARGPTDLRAWKGPSRFGPTLFIFPSFHHNPVCPSVIPEAPWPSILLTGRLYEEEEGRKGPPVCSGQLLLLCC